jgi:hypothetical protein
MVGWMRQQGWGHSSCLVTVITLLAILELHDTVGVVGTRVPHELLLQNCFKVWIVSIIFCWHHLCGDDKLACVVFIMLCFPIFLNLSHFQRGKNLLIAKSYNSIALSLWQDQNEISKCIQEAQFHGRQLLLPTPPYPIGSPPTPLITYFNATWPHPPSPPTSSEPFTGGTWAPTPSPQ